MAAPAARAAVLSFRTARLSRGHEEDSSPVGRSSQPLSSPFGSLIAEVREQALAQAFGRPRAPRAPAPRPGQEPDLLLETRAVSAPPREGARRRSQFLPASLAIHAALILAVALLPLLLSQELPPPTAAAVRGFFVDPVSAPPPPPPPPPPAPKSAVPQARPQPVTPQNPGFTAPVEAPTEVKPEEGIDLGVPGGVPGGVEGGVPGGVVGGVVGGLPDAPPPPKAIRVGGAIKEPKLLRRVNPDYPALARKAHVEGIVILECTINTAGRVTDVRVLRGLPMLDEAAVEAVKQWVFTPTLLDGVPTPVVMTITVSFSLKQSRSGATP